MESHRGRKGSQAPLSEVTELEEYGDHGEKVGDGGRRTDKGAWEDLT